MAPAYCPSSLSIAVIRHYDQKWLRNERWLFCLHIFIMIHHWAEPRHEPGGRNWRLAPLACSVCLSTRFRTTCSGMTLPMWAVPCRINLWLRKCFINFPIGQYEEGIFATEVFSCQITLACVKLTETNYPFSETTLDCIFYLEICLGSVGLLGDVSRWVNIVPQGPVRRHHQGKGKRCLQKPRFTSWTKWL